MVSALWKSATAFYISVWNGTKVGYSWVKSRQQIKPIFISVLFPSAEHHFSSSLTWERIDSDIAKGSQQRCRNFIGWPCQSQITDLFGQPYPSRILDDLPVTCICPRLSATRDFVLDWWIQHTLKEYLKLFMLVIIIWESWPVLPVIFATRRCSA